MLPEAVAYAGIAGLPPHRAILAGIAGCLIYAIFGRSRFAIVSPTSSSAAILAATLAVVPGDATVKAGLATIAVALAGLLRRRCCPTPRRHHRLHLAPGVARLRTGSGDHHHPASATDSRRRLRAGLQYLQICRRIVRGDAAMEPCKRRCRHRGSGRTAAAQATAGRPRRLPRARRRHSCTSSFLASAAMVSNWSGRSRFLPQWPSRPMPAGLLIRGWCSSPCPRAHSLRRIPGTMRALALRHGDPLEVNRELGALGFANIASAPSSRGMPVGASFSAGFASEAAGRRRAPAVLCAQSALPS